MKLPVVASLVAAALLMVGCGSSEMSAIDYQKEIGKRGKKFTPDGFVNAAGANDTGLVRLYIRGTMDVNAVGASGNTALAMAAYKGGAAAVQLLLDEGANAEVQNSLGANVLLDAATRNTPEHLEVVKVMLDFKLKELGDDKLGTSVTSAFVKAAEMGNVASLEEFVARGADVNAKAADGRNALISATNKGKKDVVKLLLDNDCELNDTDTDFNTALAYAEENGWPEIARMLRAKGAKRFKNKER